MSTLLWCCYPLCVGGPLWSSPELLVSLESTLLTSIMYDQCLALSDIHGIWPQEDPTHLIVGVGIVGQIVKLFLESAGLRLAVSLLSFCLTFIDEVLDVTALRCNTGNVIHYQCGVNACCT